MAASVTTKSVTRTHVEAAMKDLEEAIKLGKNDDTAAATTTLERALGYLNTAIKK
jgi:hypothetical protein